MIQLLSLPLLNTPDVFNRIKVCWLRKPFHFLDSLHHGTGLQCLLCSVAWRYHPLERILYLWPWQMILRLGEKSHLYLWYLSVIHSWWRTTVWTLKIEMPPNTIIWHCLLYRRTMLSLNNYFNTKLLWVIIFNIKTYY